MDSSNTQAPPRPTERVVHTAGQEAFVREHGFQTAFDPENERALFAARGRPPAQPVDPFRPALFAENQKRLAEMTAAEQQRKREARATERAAARARIAAAEPQARERLRLAHDAAGHAGRRLEQAAATVARAEAAAANARATLDELAGLDTEIGRLRASLLRAGDAGDAPLPPELADGLRLRTAAEGRLREITLALTQLEDEAATAEQELAARQAEAGEAARGIVALHVETVALRFAEQREALEAEGRLLRGMAATFLPGAGNMTGNMRWPPTVTAAARQAEAFAPDPLAGGRLRAWFTELQTSAEAVLDGARDE